MQDDIGSMDKSEERESHVAAGQAVNKSQAAQAVTESQTGQAAQVGESMRVQIPSGKLTPLMQQYWEVKTQHPDKVVLFRMGDFFEMFYRDAEIAAPILGIALTSRNKKSADETPMCGVPHFSIGGQISKLLKAGHRVAICDQLEDPAQAKGIVKRGVTRVLTPGIVFDPETLEASRACYLAAYDDGSVGAPVAGLEQSAGPKVSQSGKQTIGHVAFLDVTTGEAFYFAIANKNERMDLLERFAPTELVLNQAQKAEWLEQKQAKIAPTVSVVASLGAVTLSAHGVADNVAHVMAAETKNLPQACQTLIAYLNEMKSTEQLRLIREFELRTMGQTLRVSPTVLRHLEIFENYRGGRESTLLASIDRTKTSGGGRLLRQWLAFPLIDQAAISGRAQRVEDYTEDIFALTAVRQVLTRMGDFERRLGKVMSPNCGPRDLTALADSIGSGIEAASAAKHKIFEPQDLSLARDLMNRVFSAIREDAPVQTRQGQFIKRGFDVRLDELLDINENSEKLIVELEAREREATGIGSLKVRFNNVFGYFIEITHTHKDKVPKDRFERKQTLANAERFTTPELQAIESKVLTAQSRRLDVELAIFADLRAELAQAMPRLQDLGAKWSELDVITSLAHLAQEQAYVRPTFSSDMQLSLKGSRHPVVEQALKSPFVKNNLHLSTQACVLLTGPNMAGKSTIMRQVALTALMAQMGSFVAADVAELPIFDQIFTRIGSSDFLAEGLSTFMVEMQETADLVQHATSKSLLILDEIGRGTSTFDGMSLAQAILEHILQVKKSMTFFATHYHELTGLAGKFPQLQNKHMAIHENKGAITFLHELREGPANQSYGLHVAKLAGLSNSIVKRAQQILTQHESLSGMLGAGRGQTPQLSIFDLEYDQLMADAELGSAVNAELASQVEVELAGAPTPQPIEPEWVKEIRGMDVNRLTPLEALSKLAQWQQSLS